MYGAPSSTKELVDRFKQIVAVVDCKNHQRCSPRTILSVKTYVTSKIYDSTSSMEKIVLSFVRPLELPTTSANVFGELPVKSSDKVSISSEQKSHKLFCSVCPGLSEVNPVLK